MTDAPEHPEQRTCDRCGSELPSKYEVTKYEVPESVENGELNTTVYYGVGVLVNSIRLVRGKDADWDSTITITTHTCPDCDSRPSDARSSRRDHVYHLAITGLLFTAVAAAPGPSLIAAGLLLLACGEAVQIANHDTTTDIKFDRVAYRPLQDVNSTNPRQKFIRGEITEEEFEERIDECADEDLERITE